MRRKRLVLAIAALVGVVVQGKMSACAQEAPFGLHWGPVLEVPRPSTAERDANVTRLIYQEGRLPAELNDTEAVMLEVCAREGLQHVVWFSSPLSDSVAVAQYRAAMAEGTRRYGEPMPDAAGVGVTWPEGRTMLKWERDQAGKVHLVMVSYGPDFEACSEQHRSLTGHPATEHASYTIIKPK